MKVEKFFCRNFRNIEEAEITAHGGTNVIYGQNAQGKTNLVEGIWLFCGAKSFRSNHDGELIRFGQERAKLKLQFDAFGRSQEAEIDIEGRRSATLNGIKLKNAGELCGNFYAVVFSPSHLSLIKDGPVLRRRMLDIAIGQLYPNYVDQLRTYNRAMQQRNSLLKDVRYSSYLMDMLVSFEEAMAESGASIIEHRKKYMANLGPEITEIYKEISGSREQLRVEYTPSAFGESIAEIKKNLEKAFLSARKEDIAAGTTSVGPHREDITFLLDGINARNFGSQGQQRSCVLALKLAEAQVIKKATGEQPVMLFDDVMSELDEGRQESILNRFSDTQVFITCCEKEQLSRLKEGKTFRAQNGRIEEE